MEFFDALVKHTSCRAASAMPCHSGGVVQEMGINNRWMKGVVDQNIAR